MTPRQFILALAVLGLTVPLAWANPSTTHKVHMDQMVFVPASLSIHVGDTVEWTNSDIVPHNVISAAAKIQSGTIKPGTTWKWKATKAGSFNYKCSFHPTMTGKIQVKPASGAKPHGHS